MGRLTALGLLATCIAACAGPNQPVPMVGPAADIAALAGEWDGYYEADNLGRHGTIDFHLKAGADTAVGEVIMIPGRWGRRAERAEDRLPKPEEVVMPAVLQIQFVQVSGGEVVGQMEPYRDPDCGCMLNTTFRGRLKGDTLSGTYSSLHEEGGPPATGTWRAVRKQG